MSDQTGRRTIPHSYDTMLTGAGMLVRSCKHCPDTYILIRQEVVDPKTKETSDAYVWLPVETVGLDGNPTKELRNCVGEPISPENYRSGNTSQEATAVRRTSRLP